ncbi:hypothetical protein B0T20DRAFT_338726, partial [Sordaria brevicollis]
MLEKLPFELVEKVLRNFPLTPPKKSTAYPDYRPGDDRRTEGNDLAIRLLQNQKTLQALCLISPICRTVARSLLYKDVILKDAAALPFYLRSILESADVADLARSLTILPAFGSLYATDSLRQSIHEHLVTLLGLGEELDGKDSPNMIKRGQFDWDIRVSNDDDKATDDLVLSGKRGRLGTLWIVQSLKESLLDWIRDDRSYTHCLMEIFLFLILHRTPCMERLLLQFPLDWGEELSRFVIFGRLYHGYSGYIPDFCSHLTEVVLLSASQPRSTDQSRIHSGHAGEFPFRHFPSLNTLTIIGSAQFSHLFTYERMSTLRSLHLVDTTVSPRKLAKFLIQLPQGLTSLVYKFRATDPQGELEPAQGPEQITLSEAFRQKGSHLRELTLDFAYTTCIEYYIGQYQRLESLVTLSRLEKLTVQKQLLFYPVRFSSDEVLFKYPLGFQEIFLDDDIIPHNLVELNILEEWQIDIAERESWLHRFYQTDKVDYTDRRPGIFPLPVQTGENLSRRMHAPKDYALHSSYRKKVEEWLLDLAASCGPGKMFPRLTTVTYQVCPRKPLKLVPHDRTHDTVSPEGDGSINGTFHQFPSALTHAHWESHKEDSEDPNAPTISAIHSGSFLCWIPYRWIDISLLHETFG